MTGFLHEKEFSRKTFLKGGGALIVGLSLGGAGLAGKAKATDSPFASSGPPAQNQVDSWLVIHTDNTALLKAGYNEPGTGVSTGLLMIAAEELDMDLSRLTYAPSDTNVTASTTNQAASSGIRIVGPKVRAAAAYAKQTLLALASTRLGVPSSGLSVSKGIVSGGGKSVTYGELIGDKLFNATMAVTDLNAGQAPAKPINKYTLAGTSIPRWDIPAIVTGQRTYIHNVRVPGMVHGRVVRPRGQGVFGFGAPVVSIDENSIKHIPDVQIVRRADFVGVVAPLEYDAIQAAAQLKVTWADPPAHLSGTGDQFKQMRDLDSAGQTINQYKANNPRVDTALASAAHVISQTYKFPYQGHHPIGPLCAIGDVTPNGARILVNAAGVYNDRTSVAKVLGLPASQVRLSWFPGSSTFGGSGGIQYSDIAQAAGIMSQAVGKPVRLQMMRWDDMGWDKLGPNIMTDIRAGIDSAANIVAFDYTMFVQQYASIDGLSLALTGLAPPYESIVANNLGNVDPVLPTDVVGTTQRNGVDLLYRFDKYGGGSQNYRFLAKFVPAIDHGFQVSTLQGPNHPQSLFAYEQMIDELAYAANMDPVAFRRQNLWQADPQRDRGVGVLDAVAKLAAWNPKVAASNLSKAEVVTGRGVAINSHSPNSFGAVIADIEVNKKTGKIVVKHMYGAQDSGFHINPGALHSLMSGGMAHGVSRALHEEVQFSKKHVTSLDWVSYPILRFKDAPNTSTVLVSRPDVLPRGGGEEAHEPTPAAIANAFFDATGVRIREAPMTPARVRAALKAAGVA